MTLKNMRWHSKMRGRNLISNNLIRLNFQVKLEDFPNFEQIIFMKALFFDQSLHFREVPIPQPRSHEVLIRVIMSAICNTDQEIIRGYMGFSGIPGHEFVGEVITPTSRFYGSRVVGAINCPCGQCHLCKTGRPTHCEARTVLGIYQHNGAFAEYLVLPESNLHRIPDGLLPEIAVFTEPLAAAIQIFDQVHVPPSGNVYIFGAGKLGLLISLVFKLNGCTATTFDSNPNKVENARKLGIKAKDITALQKGDRAEMCVDCTGNPEGINFALSHLYPGGTLVMKTTVAKTGQIDFNQVVINEIRIIGSRCGPFAPAMQMLEHGLVDPRPLITSFFDFNELPDAFKEAAKPETVKIIIRHSK
jgi:threonine dehydrogenase-like Zn-dependent dehydrogenase